MNKILAGLQLIAIYDPDFDTCAEHDEFFVKHKEDVRMSDEDSNQMEKFGWRRGESHCYWSIFT